VRRYLERSLPPGGEPIRWATIQQQGTFQMGEGEGGWRPFTATQYVRAYPPGFLWDASIRMAPFVPVRVRDGYVNKRGVMKGAIAAIVTVVDAAQTPELTEGSLYRYLAEAAWVPSRLLPGEGLTWQEMDPNTALATLTESGVTVSVQFRFDDPGDIVGIFVPSRGREVDGAYVPSAWHGRFWDHEVMDGFRVPREGEVAWIVDGELVPYWRGRLVTVSYKKGE
jgi:hypothetical protein